jgi:hypothetical protein
MKIKYIIASLLISFAILLSCTEHPIDEDGLLISTQSKCYIGNFFLYGPDHLDCLVAGSTVIDTVNCTINAVAKFGSNIKYLKPAASLSIDSKLTPAMGVWTDFSEPRKYTVISGNRQIKKEYTITVTLQGQ